MVDLEQLKAEIEQFKTEAMKMHFVQVWAESYKNSDPFGYVITEATGVFWIKEQARQLWQFWKFAKGQNAEIAALKAENIELQKKYQHADTQLSDIDGHYTLLKKEVEALKAKLEQSKKVWISVDFMLPDEGEKVLLAIGDEQTVAEKCRVFGFIDSIDREALRTDLITHWMSLPEPPSKEAQGDGDE